MEGVIIGEAEGLSDEEPEFVDRVRVIGDRDRDEVRRGVFEDFTASSSSVARSDNDGDGGEEDDEEERKWEEEQVRKGLGMRREEGIVYVNVVQNVGVRSRDVYTIGVGAGNVGPSGGGLSIGVPGSGPGSGSSLDTLTIAQQAELSKKALHESVRRLKAM